MPEILPMHDADDWWVNLYDWQF